jgi:hypothetical protein
VVKSTKKPNGSKTGDPPPKSGHMPPNSSIVMWFPTSRACKTRQKACFTSGKKRTGTTSGTSGSGKWFPSGSLGSRRWFRVVPAFPCPSPHTHHPLGGGGVGDRSAQFEHEETNILTRYRMTIGARPRGGVPARWFGAPALRAEERLNTLCGDTVRCVLYSDSERASTRALNSNKGHRC